MLGEIFGSSVARSVMRRRPRTPVAPRRERVKVPVTFTAALLPGLDVACGWFMSCFLLGTLGLFFLRTLQDAPGLGAGALGERHDGAVPYIEPCCSA